MKAACTSDNWIYHELQDSALCGQHCLNNLLQQPFFTVGDLADIAEMLDIMEQQCMLEGGATPDAIAKESENVDESGNFSIEVLKCALQNASDLELVPWFPEAAVKRNEDPSGEVGFIVNWSNHWYAIRKVGEHWWDLNSVNPTPLHVSSFYLSAFLAQLVQDGYSVFAVRGMYPRGQRDSSVTSKYWHLESSLLPPPDRSPAAPFSWTGRRLDEAPAPPMTEDEQLAQAIALSLTISEQTGRKGGGGGPSDKEFLRAQRLASLQRREKAAQEGKESFA